MIRVTSEISIDESEIAESFVRSYGPGGQNVNKVATCVQVRFDASASPAISDDVRSRLAKLAGRRMTSDGVIVIEARRYRTRERNRADALDRLVELIRKAASPPPRRRKTKPTQASRLRRIESKRHRSQVKRRRKSVSDDGQ